jgi:hypothetical protein
MIFMFSFGIGFAVIIMGVLHDNDAPLSAIIVVCFFMVGWILTTLYMIVYHFTNLKRAKGMPMNDADMDSVIPMV